MKKTLLAIALALCGSVIQANTGLSAVLTVGQWLVQNHRQVYYAEVQAQASTFDQAKHQAFRLAVEHAVGTVILSETEAADLRLKRNEIVTYASGYVNRFEIVQQQQRSTGVVLTMRVWVEHSGIANRLLNRSEQSGQITGTTIDTQYQTLMHQRHSGDKLLATVLRDYPGRAFTVRMLPTEVSVDAQRKPQLNVVFDLEWSRQYLQSLREVLAAINHYPQCKTIDHECKHTQSRVELRMNHWRTNPGAWFNDTQAVRIMSTHMNQDPPVFAVTLHDRRGGRSTTCFRAPELDESQYKPQYFASVNQGSVVIHGLHSARIRLQPTLHIDFISDLIGATVTVQRQSHCLTS